MELTIEELTQENLKVISNFGLSNLLRRATQLRSKYDQIEKTDGFLSIDWDVFQYKFDLITSEYRDRSLVVPKSFSKTLTWGLCKPHWRIFTVEDLNNTPLFKDTSKIIIDNKFDGVRTKVIKDSRIRIITDPDDTSTPDKTSRLSEIVNELSFLPDSTVLDCELVMIKDNECLHRTASNALINGKFNPTEATKLAHLYVFDILKLSGKDTTSFPQKERSELITQFKDTEHIHFVRSSIILSKPSLSYYVDYKDVGKAVNKLLSQSKSGSGVPKFISEGAMLKLPQGNYISPENKYWAKYKEYFEIDCLVVEKKAITRGGKQTETWNYKLAVGPISNEWANAIDDKSFVIEYEGKQYNMIGLSDSTSQSVSVGDILRVRSEDVNKYESDDPKYTYYGAYVSIVMAPVPERHSPDGMLVLERLSELTPKRLSFVKSISADVKESIANGSIPKDIYDRYAVKGEPLPKEFYTDYREGDGFVQSHVRGISDQEVADYKSKTITLAEMLKGHSVHLDIRLDLGFPTLIQFVITDNNVKSLIDYMMGTKTKDKNGNLNVHHAMMIIKPSAEEPQMKKSEMAIDEEGSKLLAGIQNIKGSYIIPVGDIGATALKSAWMGLIWTGKVKSGTMRKDFKEYFFYPDKGNLFNGRLIFKALKDVGTARWETWLAISDSLPADPILHKDSGYYYPVKAEQITKFGRDQYIYGKKD